MGPSLGRDSVEAGTNAALIGFILTLAFMVMYYRWSGVLACVAMVLNLVIEMAILAQLHATLTLPGVAGLILTIGMSVDANVLIFERIREELATRQDGAAASIEAGYQPGVRHHSGLERHHADYRRGAVAVRHRAGEGLRDHA